MFSYYPRVEMFFQTILPRQIVSDLFVRLQKRFNDKKERARKCFAVKLIIYAVD